MKKLFVLAFALILGTSLSLAQATGGSTDKTTGTNKTASGKKATKTHSKKGGKKGKKSSGGTTTQPPK
jgi:hypothetical protein